MSVSTVPAQPSLGGLPVEVTEIIASLLDLANLCSLRLTSSEIAAKASQGCFKTFFRNKEIDLDNSEELETFRQITRPKDPGCLVQTLTLLRYVPPEDEGNSNVAASPNRSVLVECFGNLRINAASGTLEDLSLDVRTKDDPERRSSPHRSMWDRRTWETPDNPTRLKGSRLSPHRRHWKSSWNKAALSYRETMAALHESELPVKRLSLFGDTENCSLSFDQLASYPEQVLPSTSFAKLEDLSLSLSHSMEFHATNDEATEAAASTPASHIHRLETVLQLCPRLKTLDLHFFKIWISREDERSDVHLQERRFFDHIATSMSFPNLRSCTLRGINCRFISMQRFVESAPQLQHVDLINASLFEGQWRPVFDALIARKLESLHLDDLDDERGAVYFIGPRGKPRSQPKLARQGQRTGTDELTRSGTETGLPIKYQVSKGRFLGSPVKDRYLTVKEWLYGPIVN